MTAQDMQIFEKYCKRCHVYCHLHCAFLCLSNETCGGVLFRPDEEKKEKRKKTDSKYSIEYLEDLFNND